MFQIVHKFLSKNGFRIMSFVTVNRILAAISLGVDGIMIYLIKNYGFWFEMVAVNVLFFVVCSLTLLTYDFFSQKGYDLLSMDYFHELRDEPLEKKNFLKRFTQWILRREKTIFWLGSLWLEPDVVTLLLRKGEKTKLKDIVSVTLPSVVLCITFWSVVFYLGLKGYVYFSWFVK